MAWVGEGENKGSVEEKEKSFSPFTAEKMERKLLKVSISQKLML